jgi:hypothetical protein
MAFGAVFINTMVLHTSQFCLIFVTKKHNPFIFIFKNINMNLSKPDKKIARILIDKGVMIEKTALFLQLEQTLADWRSEKKDVAHTYADIYRQVREKDKAIASRYDDLGGSLYFFTVLQLLNEGIIDDADIAGFSEQVKAAIELLRARVKSYQDEEDED